MTVGDLASKPARAYAGQPLEARRSDQRRRIMSAARVVFARGGYAGATLDQIVKRARVSRTSFYEFFESKEQCLLAVFEEGMLALGTALNEVTQLPLTPRARVRAEVEAVARTFASDPDMARVVLIEMVGASPAAEAARVQARLAMAAVIERQLAEYDYWARRPESERRLVSMSSMAAIVEPLSHLVATGALGDWEAIVDPVADYVASGLIRLG